MNTTMLQILEEVGIKGKLFQVVIVIFFILLLIAILRANKPLSTVLSHWHHRFETVSFSPEEFYSALQAVMTQKEMNKLHMAPMYYAEGGWLSPKRKYIRVQYGRQVFDICAAPFAKEFFVSWWFGELSTPMEDLLMAFPLLGRYFKVKKRNKSFFELDSEVMFKESVSSCVKATIEQLTQEKGMRKLSMDDWREYNSPY